MTPDDIDLDVGLSRRTLLGVGAAGALTLGAVGGARALAGPVEYDHTATVPVRENAGGRGQQPGTDLRVDWAEWYNGRRLESQETPTDRGGVQPLVHLENLLPGDSGTVAVGLRTERERGSPPPVQLEMRVRELPGSRAEHGRSEPEIEAGDDTPDEGELQDFLRLALWYDSGIEIGDTPLYGHCDGRRNAGDRPIAEGTFAEVALAPDTDEWIALDAHPDAGTDCLRGTEALCVGVGWEVRGENPNLIQGDAVRFALEFAASDCR